MLSGMYHWYLSKSWRISNETYGMCTFAVTRMPAGMWYVQCWKGMLCLLYCNMWACRNVSSVPPEMFHVCLLEGVMLAFSNWSCTSGKTSCLSARMRLVCLVKSNICLLELSRLPALRYTSAFWNKIFRASWLYHKCLLEYIVCMLECIMCVFFDVSTVPAGKYCLCLLECIVCLLECIMCGRWNVLNVSCVSAWK